MSFWGLFSSLANNQFKWLSWRNLMVNTDVDRSANCMDIPCVSFYGHHIIIFNMYHCESMMYGAPGHLTILDGIPNNGYTSMKLNWWHDDHPSMIWQTIVQFHPYIPLIPVNMVLVLYEIHHIWIHLMDFWMSNSAQFNVAMENGHRNSGFVHLRWWCSLVRLVYRRG